MDNMLKLQKEKSIIEGECVEYELVSVQAGAKERYIVEISYLGETCIGAIDVSDRTLAQEIFSLLIRTQTTPDILTDTLYDIFH